MARILGRKGRDYNGIPISNLHIPDRTKLADHYDGITTNPRNHDWSEIKLDNVRYNTRGLGEKYGKLVTKPIDNLLLDPHGITTGVLNKGWRAMILVNRGLGVPNDQSLKKSIYDPARSSRKVYSKKQDRDNDVMNGKNVIVDQNTYRLSGQQKPSSEVFRFIGSTNEPDNLPYKEDVTHKGFKDWLIDNNNQVIIYNISSSPYEYLVLQTRPPQLDFKGETYWATIKSMGRNNPIYHYTGAEDTLQFNISWFSTNINQPDEVVNKCRLLESWSKANGYNSAPPVLNIQWGNDSEHNLLVNQDYILISATYSLRNFNNGVRKRLNNGNWEKHNLGLWPSIATQELIFKRVSSTNLIYEDILPSDKKALVVKTSNLM